MIRSPILFIIFNRPQETKQVLEAIRTAKPTKLYIAADGSREYKESDKELCERTRTIATNIGWECEVKTLFREKNLGCKYAVSSAIDWFFENEEEGIILEDDCLPDSSFFSFCDELLEKYRYDTRVMKISGFNTLGKTKDTYSYFFSKLGSIWGWASWRRAWHLYDIEMTLFPEVVRTNIFNQIFALQTQSNHRYLVCKKTFDGEIETWDYQWSFACLIHGGSAIVPRTNLVTNIGFNENATHTKDLTIRDVYPNKLTLEFPLKHPPYFYINHDFDNKVFNITIGSNFRIGIVEEINKIFQKYCR